MKVLHVSQKNNDIRAQRAVFATPEHDHALVLGVNYEPGSAPLIYRGEFCKAAVASIRSAAGKPAITKTLAEIKPDVIHLHEPLTAAIVPLPNVPIVVDHHEWELDRSIQWDSPRLRQIREDKVTETVNDPRVVAHIVPSEMIRDVMVKRYPKTAGRVFVSHNAPPTLTADYQPRPDIARDVLNEFVKPDDKFLVFCGYMTSDRRIDLLLNTILRLQAKDPTWRILALSPPHTVPSALQPMLDATAMLCVDTLPYPWPWALDKLTMIDVIAMGTVGWSFAEVGFTSWRGSAPNKTFEYAAAGIPQMADRGTWMADAFEHNAVGCALNDDPGLIADRVRWRRSPRPRTEWRCVKRGRGGMRAMGRRSGISCWARTLWRARTSPDRR